MQKDPAALMYISTYLTTTAEMPGDALGWYTRLIMHHYDKGSLPKDMEALAMLANVRMSEFTRFQEVFKVYLKHLFTEVGEDRLANIETIRILEARESYKDQKSGGGKIGVFLKYLRKNVTKDEKLLQFIKENVKLTELVDGNTDLIQGIFKEVFDEKVKLYINRDKDKTIAKNTPELDLVEENLVSRTVDKYKEIFDNDYLIDQDVVKECGYNPSQLAKARFEFWNDKKLDDEMVGKDYKDVKLHFLRWNRMHKDRIKKDDKGPLKIQGSLDQLESLTQKYA